MQQLAFQNSVLVHKDRMYRLALSFMKDEDEAKDVVQDVMMKLWETRNELENKQNIEAWCISLTRNKALDKIKRVGRKMKTELDSLKQPFVSNDPSPLQSLLGGEAHKIIEFLIRELPEKQRSVFHLREIEGLSYLEIAECLMVDINQVKVNIFRARKALKEKLENIYSYGR